MGNNDGGAVWEHHLDKDFYFRIFNINIQVSLGKLNALPISPATAAQQKSVIALVEAVYRLTADEIVVVEGR